MESMGPCCRGSAPVSVSWVHSLAAHSPTHTAMSNKVRHHDIPYIQKGADPCMHALGSVGLVSRFGQFYKSVDPGLVNVNVCTESLRVVDVKIQISPIGRQMVM